MSWLARKIIDLTRAATQFYYSRKYRALAHQLGRPELDDHPDSPRTVIIQIDGLSYSHLQTALAQGYMPHLHRALDDDHLYLTRWHCGLPSTTPATQAGILYGDNYDIPGFRWYEKERGVSIVCKRPDQLLAMSKRLRRSEGGLLRGGSSYTNLFDGDASLAVFTVSALGSTFFNNVRGLGFALLFLFSPGRVLRVFARSIHEYARDLAHRVSALFHAQVLPPTGWSSPLLRIVIDVVFAEMQTFGVMLDIYRGVPIIYTTYYGYDDSAHHYGPDHPETMRTLRHIDAYFHHINRMRKQYRRYAYDMYILSDHGASPSTPFQARFGQTLGQFILSSIGEALALDERADAEKQPAAHAQYLLNELGVFETRLSNHSAAIVRRARRALERRAPTDPEFLDMDVGRRSDIVVRSSGGLAHVYFNVTPRRLNLSEIAVLYPALLNRLIEHPGIGLVIGREDDKQGKREISIIGRGGTRAHFGGQVSISGVDPLATLTDPDGFARDLIRLAHFPHSGDLILLGAWEANGHVITFEDQAGTHGGIGGLQNEPFIIVPAADPQAGPPPRGPVELYHHLMHKYKSFVYN